MHVLVIIHLVVDNVLHQISRLTRMQTVPRLS